MALQAADTMGSTFRGVDLDAQLSLLAHDLVAKVIPKQLPDTIYL